MWSYLSNIDLGDSESPVFCERCQRSSNEPHVCILSCNHLIHQKCSQSRVRYFDVNHTDIMEPRCPCCSPPKKRKKRSHP